MAHNILTIKNALVKLAPTRTAPVFTEFGDAIQSVTLQIASSIVKWEPVSGANQQDVTPPVYQLVLDLGQDLTAGSLWNYLMSNHGAKGKAEFYPKGGVAPKIAADVVISISNALGGKANEVATSGTTMPIDGVPVITAG